MTAPDGMVDVFGTQVAPKDIAAQYRAEPDGWVDMPEARPRARCQLKPGDDRDPRVFVMADGSLRFDKTGVVIDEYRAEMFAPLRAENEARWAAIDKTRQVRR
jgi:hypothetical protein